jgi:response regulator RpfG family c-di-GMP phosphodiesterase
MEKEDRLLLSLENFLDNDIEFLRENIQSLIKNYRRKSRRLDKIIAQSDRQQMQLIHLNEELERTNAELDQYKNNLEEKVREGVAEILALNREIEETQKEVVFTMGAIGEERSRETGNHVKRVAEYSRVLALGLGMDKSEADLIKLASPMHDIGKVAIPDSILKKAGPLSDEEFELMKSHTTLGYNMLKHSERPILKASAVIAFQHHEKWDGSGYPQGLGGTAIHIYGRITALADVFDALGSQRIYKRAWKDQDIFELFRQERGRHFDPELVDIFFDKTEKFLRIRNVFHDTI